MACHKSMFDKWKSTKTKEIEDKSPELKSIESLLSQLNKIEIAGRVYNLSTHRREGLTGSSESIDAVANEVFKRKEMPEDPQSQSGPFTIEWGNPSGVTREDLADVEEKLGKINEVLMYMNEKGLAREVVTERSEVIMEGPFSEQAEVLRLKKLMLETIMEAAKKSGV